MSSDLPFNLDRLASLLDDLNQLLRQVSGAVRAPAIREFLRRHRDEPGFKEVAVPALLAAEKAQATTAVSVAPVGLKAGS
jgi:hypothetical protein